MRNWTTGPYHFEEGRKQELLPTKKRDSKEFVEKRKSKKERKKESGDWFPVFFLFFFPLFFFIMEDLLIVLNFEGVYCMSLFIVYIFFLH